MARMESNPVPEGNDRVVRALGVAIECSRTTREAAV